MGEMWVEDVYSFGTAVGVLGAVFGKKIRGVDQGNTQQALCIM